VPKSQSNIGDGLNRSFLVQIVILFVALLVVMIFALGAGAVPIPGREVLFTLWGRIPFLTMSMIQFRELSISYNGQSVLEQVSLVVAAGERAAILGANGAGKTTLQKLIGGTLHPARSSVIITGTPLESLSQRGATHRDRSASFRLSLRVFGSRDRGARTNKVSPCSRTVVAAIHDLNLVALSRSQASGSSVDKKEK
jgi:hypothetical protein